MNPSLYDYLCSYQSRLARIAARWTALVRMTVLPWWGYRLGERLIAEMDSPLSVAGYLWFWAILMVLSWVLLEVLVQMVVSIRAWVRDGFFLQEFVTTGHLVDLVPDGSGYRAVFSIDSGLVPTFLYPEQVDALVDGYAEVRCLRYAAEGSPRRLHIEEVLV